MAKILAFKPLKASQKHKGNTLCRHGHHRWAIDKEQVFDTRQGRLVTRWRCSRCGSTKNKAI